MEARSSRSTLPITISPRRISISRSLSATTGHCRLARVAIAVFRSHSAHRPPFPLPPCRAPSASGHRQSCISSGHGRHHESEKLPQGVPALKSLPQKVPLLSASMLEAYTGGLELSSNPQVSIPGVDSRPGIDLLSANGAYYSPDRVGARVEELMKAVGLEGVRLHSLRHTNVRSPCGTEYRWQKSREAGHADKNFPSRTTATGNPAGPSGGSKGVGRRVGSM